MPCKSPYYYADIKICLKECDEYYYITTSEELYVHSCTKDQYIHPGKKCTSTPCPGDTSKECVESCPEGYNYIIDNTNECVKENNANKKILYGARVDDCPSVFSESDNDSQNEKPNDAELFKKTESGIQSIN